MSDSVDVLVIGAGPAGSTIARLLKSWGYAVAMLEGRRQRHAAAETLPPGVHGVLDAIGIWNEVAEAGFYRDAGTTSWWASQEARVDNYPEPQAGFHVDRGAFDDLLTGLARREGVKIVHNSRAPVADLSSGRVEHDGGSTTARFMVDATGRAGLLARQIRRFWDERYNTVALCGVFRAGGSEWDVDPHHSLVEAYESGWAWSVPLGPDRRHVCFLVDAASARTGVETAFDLALRETVHFRRLFGACEREGAPWSRDANLYHAERYAGPHWILVGDAGSFVDPLSSSGLHKALVSAWTGAAVVNTCLTKADMAGAAVDFFNAREERIYADHARRAARQFAEAAGRFGGPFWEQRSTIPAEPSCRAGELQSMYERLRRPGPVRFRLREPAESRRQPALRGREIVFVDHPVLPSFAGVESIHGIHLVTLAEMAGSNPDVDALHAAYAARHGFAPLPDFVSVLALLVAKGVLEVAS